MDNLSRQIAAWCESWRRLAAAGDDARERFLRTIGERLGETDPGAAIRRGRTILGIDGACAAKGRR